MDLCQRASLREDFCQRHPLRENAKFKIRVQILNFAFSRRGCLWHKSSRRDALWHKSILPWVMDSLTHIALGAIIGEAYGGKELGKRAMIIGALAQSLPDVDFVMSFWLSPVDNLLAHRGFAHSIIFGTVVSALLGIAATRWSRPATFTTNKWAVFFAIEISVHLILDAFNNYGVGWFEPFSHARISFDVIFVADPFYSIWLGCGCLA